MIKIKTHSRSEDEVQKILADCDLHNTIRQQEAHLHHDVAPEEGAADALRPYFLFWIARFMLLGVVSPALAYARAVRSDLHHSAIIATRLRQCDGRDLHAHVRDCFAIPDGLAVAAPSALIIATEDSIESSRSTRWS